MANTQASYPEYIQANNGSDPTDPRRTINKVY